jgi:hypothetical protein
VRVLHIECSRILADGHGKALYLYWYVVRSNGKAVH